MASPLRIAFIGDGGISRDVRETLKAIEDQTPGTRFETVAVFSRPPASDSAGPAVGDLPALLATRPDVVVECAGHGAVVDYGEAILRSGTPLLLVSIGSLADMELYGRLLAAATSGGTRLILASGAMAGIDALASARLGGLTRVRYTGRKPPLAWRGTPAEDLIDLVGLVEPTTFYRGTAREAARLYPKNSNVAATIALAGLGFEGTEVELVADPTIAKNVHDLMFEGADGRFHIDIRGEPSKANPKTSALTAHSIARVLSGMASPVVI